MATNSIDGFFEELSKNPELQKQYVEIFEKVEHQVAQSLAQLSQQTSSPFTAEEYLRPATQDSSAEISDEALAGVSGGVWGAVGGAVVGFVTSMFAANRARVLSGGTIKMLDYLKDAVPAIVSAGSGIGHAGEKVVEKFQK
jgi:hypothetical protein